MSRVMNRWLLLLSLPFLSSTQSPPIVPTQYGEVKGFYFDSIYDVRAIIFLGIPFAKPPVGDLRFEVSADRFSSTSALISFYWFAMSMREVVSSFWAVNLGQARQYGDRSFFSLEVCEFVCIVFIEAESQQKLPSQHKYLLSFKYLIYHLPAQQFFFIPEGKIVFDEFLCALLQQLHPCFSTQRSWQDVILQPVINLSAFFYALLFVFFLQWSVVINLYKTFGGQSFSIFLVVELEMANSGGCSHFKQF